MPNQKGFFIEKLKEFQKRRENAKSNLILREICFFLEISPLVLHNINSKSAEETGTAQGRLDFREHIQATTTWKQKKIQKDQKKL